MTEPFTQSNTLVVPISKQCNVSVWHIVHLCAFGTRELVTYLDAIVILHHRLCSYQKAAFPLHTKRSEHVKTIGYRRRKKKRTTVTNYCPLSQPVRRQSLKRAVERGPSQKAQTMHPCDSPSNDVWQRLCKCISVSESAGCSHQRMLSTRKCTYQSAASFTVLLLAPHKFN